MSWRKFSLDTSFVSLQILTSITVPSFYAGKTECFDSLFPC
jgi:hypothetical protein